MREYKISISHVKREAGFTIIELLVVLVVVLSIGGIIGSIFFVSLRSSSKSNKIAAVRQNGNAAITQMAREIRYAQKFVGMEISAGIYSPTCNGTIYNKLQVSNTNPATSAEVITEIECPQNSSLTNNAIKIGDPLAPLPVTDTFISKVNTCSLSCQTQPNGLTTINILFDMVDPNANDVYENDVKPIKFETSVTMRNKQQ